MVRFVLSHLRRRASRTVALLAGMLLATTGFVVLTGTTTTSRLAVTDAVRRDTRAAYDILVRASGSRTPLEATRGAVRPNYLSGEFGGVTLDQYERVRTVPGIDVAAPIAMLGYATTPLRVRLDLTDVVDAAADRQVIRIDPTFLAERGLSRAKAAPLWVYVTRNPMIYPDGTRPDPLQDIRYTNGETWSAEQCGPYTQMLSDVPREVFPDGHSEPVCTMAAVSDGTGSVRSDLDVTQLWGVRLRPDGRFENAPNDVPAGGYWVPNGPRLGAVTDRLTVTLTWNVPMLLAAVDPPAENRLVGLDAATVNGRALRAADAAVDTTTSRPATRTLPVVATSQPFVDATVTAALSRLRPGDVAAVRTTDLRDAVGGIGAFAMSETSHDVAASHRATMDAAVAAAAGGLQGGPETQAGLLETVLQPGPPEYELADDGSLKVRTFPGDPRSYASERYGGLPVPWLAADLSFRPLRQLGLERSPDTVLRRAGWRPVGVFDPQRLASFPDLGRVPLETYEPPGLTGADAASRQALGDRELLPSGNPGGYLSPPPLLLTTLAAVPGLLEGGASPQLTAPISAIRVRIAGDPGYSDVRAERVRVIAEEIARRTGLDVDITYGSSPSPQVVELAGGSFGRPPLRLSEGWSVKGVAGRIVQAVDRKSVLLLGLVLVVCGLYLGNAVSAAVRDRRTELATLSALGWPARRVAAAILGEVAVVGLVAGLLSCVLAWSLGHLLGVRVTAPHAALAVPVAVALALLAAAAPVARAVRRHPAAALRPAAEPVRRSWHPRSVVGVSLVNLVRVPGRTLLGALSLAIGVAALTVLAAVVFAFEGTVVGSLLGDAVAVRVRGADAVAAGLTVVLGALAVADVLYLNVRDRSGELAALRATGWHDGALGRLVLYEGLGIGVLGAVVGAALGLAAAATFAGGVSGSLVGVSAGTACVGVLVTGAAALVPAALLSGQPTARLLAEE